ncbi:restriction endonuclease subunit S [Microbulbifer sp. TRSA001]|uniref:restriction endonuclease subunit S n=1 Tax=Microbulbifer sp. TRSA001 TaxID=3243381 RepID=UPI004039F828
MVPKGWKITSLGEVCSGNLQTGPFGSQLHSHEYLNSGVPVLMPKDLTECRANIESAAKISNSKAAALQKHLLRKGDLLFSRRGDVTKFALIDELSEGSICGTGCLKARPSENHSPAFLSYFLQKEAVKKWLEKNSVGQTMPNMNTQILNELPLVIASSRQEEDKIAHILSTWDKAIDTSEKLLANSRQQKKALMQQLLTGKKRLRDKNGVRFSAEWTVVTFNDVLNIEIGGTPSRSNPNYWDEGKTTNNQWLSIADLKSSRISDTSEYISDLGAKNSSVSLIPSGTIVMSFKLTIGRRAILSEDCFTNEAICALIINNNDQLYHDYLYQALEIVDFDQEIDQAVKGKTLNKAKLKRLKLKLPELEEQQKIAATLSSADQEIETLQQKLDCLKQEKKALMQQLLTGKRRVQVENAQ